MLLVLFLTGNFAVSTNWMQTGTIEAQEDKWSGALRFNLSSATGNTNNTVLGGKALLARKYGALTHAIEGGGNFTETTQIAEDGSENTETTQNNWFTQYRLEVQTGDTTFVFGRIRYEEDQFSGFDRKGFVGAGIGHTAVETEQRELRFLIGPGVQYLERTRPDPLPEDFVEEETSLALFIGQNFRQQINENIELGQSFDATMSEENSTFAPAFEIKSELTERISLRTVYTVKHETDPPEGRQQTDTLLTASIGYEF
jgi:putative salt-induced outer membrane protein